TESLESPALVGLWEARILIPGWLVEGSKSPPLNNSALAWALRHELAHRWHGDLWLIRLREFVQALFYFHPCAWWAGRELETAIEIACDRSVVTTDAEAADYAQKLYEILQAVRHRRCQPLVGG